MNIRKFEVEQYLNFYRYNSKFRDNVKDEYKSNRNDHKTMGYAKVPVDTTDNFLKKRSKEPILPDSEFEI